MSIFLPMSWIWAWIGGAIGVVFLLIIVMALPDIVRYLRMQKHVIVSDRRTKNMPS